MKPSLSAKLRQGMGRALFDYGLHGLANLGKLANRKYVSYGDPININVESKGVGADIIVAFGLQAVEHPAETQGIAAEQRLRLTRSELFDTTGHTVWRVRYDDYRVVRDGDSRVELPFVVHFEDERHDADTLVRFQDIALNVEVPEGAFSQTPTPGLTSEFVACDP